MIDFIEMCELHSNITIGSQSRKKFYHFANAEFKITPGSEIVEWEWYFDDADDEEDDYDYGTCTLNDIRVLFADSESMRISIGKCEMEVLFAKF